MIEVELKFRLEKKTELEDKLVRAGYKKSKPLHQVDRVFLLKSDSLADFTLGDPVTRIRTINDQVTTLTYKRAMNAKGDRIEHEMQVEPAHEAEAMLLEMGYKPVAAVDKLRIEYKRGDITVTIDQVKGLGRFAEVEIVCKKGEEEKALAKIKSVAKEFGLNENDIEPLKYDQMTSRLAAK